MPDDTSIPQQWQSSQPPPWAPPTQPPGYNDALSRLWHQNFAQNDPQTYAAKYAPDYSGTSDIMLDPARAGLDEMDPRGAQARGSLSANALKGMAEGAFPGLSTGVKWLGNALTSNPLNAGEPAPQQTNRVKELDELISQEIAKKNAALNAAGTPTSSRSGSRATGYTTTKTITPPDDATVARISKPYDDKIANYQTERQTLMPFMQTGPQWERDLINHAPEIAGLSGAGIGLLTRNPALAMVLGGSGAGIESGFGSTWPTIQDMKLPENSPAGQEARKNWDDWNWWRRGPVAETGASMLLGAGGAKFGNMGRKALSEAGGALKGLFSRGSEGASSVSTAPQNALARNANVKPDPVSVDSKGREIHIGTNGKTMFQGVDNRWHNVGGGMVKKSDRPSWWNQLNP